MRPSQWAAPTPRFKLIISLCATAFLTLLLVLQLILRAPAFWMGASSALVWCAAWMSLWDFLAYRRSRVGGRW